MTGRFKTAIGRRWPVLRLRSFIFATLSLAVLVQLLGTVFLRIYENTLVRQTEAELIAQGAAISALAEQVWPGRVTALPAEMPSLSDVATQPYGRPDPYYLREPTTVDLSAMTILPPRPPARRAGATDPAAVEVASVLAPVMLRTSRTTLASIQLLDRNGTVVSGYEKGLSHVETPEVRTALEGRSITLLRRSGEYHPRYSFEWLSRASGIRLHHARPILIDGKVAGVLLLTRSPRALFQGIYEDIGKVALGGLFVLLVLILLTAVVVRAVVRPIEALSRATKDVTDGQGTALRPPTLGVVEIRELYANFNAMSEAIARRSAYLRDFAAAVSHEFKTPLTGIRGAIELLEDHGGEMSSEERSRFLGNVRGDCERLSHLVRRLMDLAKADMQLTADDVAADAEAAIARVADGQRGEDFEIDIEFPVGLPPLCAAPAAIEAIATVLIENSRQAGARWVGITAMRDGGRVRVRFEDDGSGVAAGDRDRIFDPFFTSKRSAGGTGLGLAIARSLATASKGELVLAATERGTGFDLVLPVAQAKG